MNVYVALQIINEKEYFSQSSILRHVNLVGVYVSEESFYKDNEVYPLINNSLFYESQRGVGGTVGMIEDGRAKFYRSKSGTLYLLVEQKVGE